MNNIEQQPQQGTDDNLERVVEPLAAYICATERPQAALKLALAALLNQVEETNQTAASRIAAFRASRLAASA